jgi:hypothetical protein
MKSIIEDMYPGNNGKTLIEQMIEAGKKLYVLDNLLPETADTLKTGYTQKQLDGCYANEKFIWSYFVNGDLLFGTASEVNGQYINDGPKTQDLGEDSPGAIGQFVGWQIVKQWMSKHDKLSMEALLKKNPKELFEESKYQPK